MPKKKSTKRKYDSTNRPTTKRLSLNIRLDEYHAGILDQLAADNGGKTSTVYASLEALPIAQRLARDWQTLSPEQVAAIQTASLRIAAGCEVLPTVLRITTGGAHEP